MNCTIAEALAQKRRIEESLLLVLLEFSRETGLRVTRVRLEDHCALGADHRLSKVSLQVELAT